VAHVSVASFHEVMNIITAPRMHVSRDLHSSNSSSSSSENAAV
jgi:hypothetical protein